jgi:uncharacterized protein (TIGR02996 family)
MARARAKPAARKTKPVPQSTPAAARAPASRPWTEPELAEIERAWAAHDADRLEKLGSEVGVRFTTDALARIDAARRGIERREVLMAMAEAMASEHGIAVRELQVFMRAHICVAAVGPHGLAIAFRGASNKGTGIGRLWPALRPWYRELARNRPRVDAWLAAPDDDRFELAIAAPEPAAPAPVDDIRGLIAAIVATPDDDTPRAVLADLLQQRADPHGELIMLMCRDRAGSDDDRKEIDARIARLLQDHGRRIAGAVAERAAGYRIERGFVDAVTMTAGAFSAHGERLFADHPIRELALRPVNPDVLAKLARTPALGRVRALKLEQDIGRERDLPIGPLLASPHFTRLERLRLVHWHARDWRAAFATLAAPVVKVEIHAGDFELAGLIPLLTSSKMPRLARLDLTAGMFTERFTAPTADEVEAIADALAGQTRLTAFRLDGDSGGLQPRHWKQIFRSPGGRALEAFALEHRSFDDDDLDAITSDRPCALRSLNLCRSGVHADAIVRFLRSAAGARVEQLLTWSSEAVPIELAPALHALPASHPLRYVGIGRVELGDRFLDANVTRHPEAARRGWR